MLNDDGSFTFWMTEPGTALPVTVAACQNILVSSAPRGVEQAVAHQPQIGIGGALEGEAPSGRRWNR